MGVLVAWFALGFLVVGLDYRRIYTLANRLTSIQKALITASYIHKAFEIDNAMKMTFMAQMDPFRTIPVSLQDAVYVHCKETLAELGLDGTPRAEDLDIETHLRLCAVFG